MSSIITKRTLTKWRKEALLDKPDFNGKPRSYIGAREELNQRILRLTLILLDQELMKGK